ncbi:MAG TPA: peptidase domain-containing ABC transporter [Usitatibacter sp.]|nr:peptidase domain-containing ABC transporter [Usitatibacter sp.]
MDLRARAAVEGPRRVILDLFRPRVPIILQSEAPECGIACLAMVASYHGHRTDLSAMRVRLSPSLKGITLKNVAQIAETMGMSARGVQVPLESLGKLRLPAILHWDMNHFVVLTEVAGRKITVHDPARGKRTMSFEDASRHFTGVAMEFTPNSAFQKTDERAKIHAWDLLGVAAGLKGTIAQILLLSFALEVFAIAQPFFLQLVVDRVLVGRDQDLLTVLGIAFATLIAISVVVTAVRAWVGVYLSTSINLRLMSSLFDHMLKLPLGWFEKRNIGDIVSKFRSVDSIQRTLSTTFVETAVDGVMVILTLIVMFYYSVTLTLVVLVAASLYAGARWIFYYPQRNFTDEQLAHEARAGTHFIETLRGMMAIKLNLRESERRSAYQNLVVDQTNAGVRVQNVGILQRGSNALIFGLENVTVIWLAALQVMDGKFSVGMLYGFIGFKLLFLGRIINLVDKWNDFRMLDLHVERIADIALAATEAHKAALPVEMGIGGLSIEAKGLGYAYGPEGFVFRDVSLTVPAGGSIAVVGPSGSGKTTLIKVLLGLLPPTEGDLRVNGRSLADWEPAQYRSRVGAVMQDDSLFVGTIEDNISFFDTEHDPQRVRECAKLAMIDEDIAGMPMQYNTIVGSLGMALSGGQKQRVLLARALYRKPQILFLDEAFDQVDMALERGISARLAKLNISLVLVSHRPETVAGFESKVELSKPTSFAVASAAPAANGRDATTGEPEAVSGVQRLVRPR